MRKYYPGITLFKLIGSLLVLFGHIKLPEYYLQLTQQFTGLNQMLSVVVPCFYMIAGFLACKGWQNASNPHRYINRYLSWILLIYGAFCLLYIGTSTIPELIHNWNIIGAASETGKLLFRKVFVIGPYYQLWFIPPLIVGIFIAYYFDQKSKFNIAVLLALLGFIIAQFLFGTIRVITEVTYGDMSLFHIKYIKTIKSIAGNYFGCGVPFVLAGVLIAKNEEKFKCINASRLALFTFLLIAVESLFLYYFVGGQYHYNLLFSMLPFSVLLFYGVLHIKAENIRTHHAFINKLSMVLYFSHFLLINLNLTIFGWNGDHLTGLQAALCLILTFCEASAVTLILKPSAVKKSALAPERLN